MLYNRKKTFILFFALLTSVLLLNTANNNAFAQVGTLQENPFSKENYTEAKKLERLVYNTILPYLKGTNFLVDVKIKSPQYRHSGYYCGNHRRRMENYCERSH